MLHESEQIEFKSEAIPNICKSVIAFANSNGGKLYIGINDNGKINKLTDIDDIYTRITNTIRDAILPDITMFIRYTLDEQGFIIIDIAEGSAKPYYLKAKGLKSSGVFIRQGASSVPASQDQIRQFIKLSDGNSYEAMRSLNQELSFTTAQNIFQSNKLEFDESKYTNLGLRNLRISNSPIWHCLFPSSANIASRLLYLKTTKTQNFRRTANSQVLSFSSWKMPSPFSCSATKIPLTFPA